jgi:4,5-DOPA dioxygenase extradiol
VTRAAALFVSHGAPTSAIESNAWSRSLEDFGRRRRPSAIVVVSAHWEAGLPVRVSSSERHETLHDFSGFPAALYELRYPAPGSPALAAEIVALLKADGIASRAEAGRPLDHGAWVPLRFLFPEADVPVVPVALPRPGDAALVLRIGSLLSDLRGRGVLLLGSGGGVHNLARVSFADRDAPPQPWAREFDRWLAERVESRDAAYLVRWRELAPHASLAHPSPEHLEPLFFPLGASRDDDRLEVLYEGIDFGTLSMRSFAFVEEGARASDR